jgi:stage III sporulation protein AD
MVEIIIKAIAISLISQLASDVCKDTGQNALSTLCRIAGKVGLLCIAIPLIKDLLDFVYSLL